MTAGERRSPNPLMAWPQNVGTRSSGTSSWAAASPADARRNPPESFPGGTSTAQDIHARPGGLSEGCYCAADLVLHEPTLCRQLPMFWQMAVTANRAEHDDAVSFAGRVAGREPVRFMTVLGARHTTPAWRVALPDLSQWRRASSKAGRTAGPSRNRCADTGTRNSDGGRARPTGWHVRRRGRRWH